MTPRHLLMGAMLLVGLAGCNEVDPQDGLVAPAESVEAVDVEDNGESTEPADHSEQRRMVTLDGADLDCPQKCGLEARGDVYATCLADGGDRADCGIRARAVYRDCLESQCTADDVRRDDCRASCRVDAAADRDA